MLVDLDALHDRGKIYAHWRKQFNLLLLSIAAPLDCDNPGAIAAALERALAVNLVEADSRLHRKLGNENVKAASHKPLDKR